MPQLSGLPLIGISTMDDHDAAGVHAPRFSNNQSYSRAVEAAGGVPILIPHLEDPDALRRIYDVLDALMVPGGLDVHPKHYNQEPHPALDPTDVGLDRTELAMLPWALEDDMPVLGICRGEQVINVVMGGTLVQDIYTQYATTIDHRESFKRRIRDFLAHDIAIDSGSYLREVVGSDRVWVNTAHHQSIDKVAPGLVATAWAPDGIVEAIEGTGNRYLVAVQCHPEELWRKHEWARKLFAGFVGAAAEARQHLRRHTNPGHALQAVAVAARSA
jgi:putative glutamine amidotransferase